MRALLHSELETAKPKTRMEAEHLRLAGGVGQVRQLSAGIFSARVGYVRPNNVSLEVWEDYVDSECNCDAPDVPCKHVVAVMLELLAQPADGAVPDSAAAATTGPASSAFLRDMEEKLGRAPAKSAAKLLRNIEHWWQQKLPQVAGVEFNAVCGFSGYGFFHLQAVPIHPAGFQPADALEYLVCVVRTMRSRQLPVSPDIAKLITPELEKDVAARCQRIADVQEWRRRLGTWREDGTEEVSQAPEFRLYLCEGGALVQARVPGANDFVKATAKLLKEWGGRGYGQEQRDQLSAGSSIVLEAAMDPYAGVSRAEVKPLSPALNRCLARLASSRELLDLHVAGAEGDPLAPGDEPLRWELKEAPAADGDYELRLVEPDGSTARPPVAVLPGQPMQYVTTQSIYQLPSWPFGNEVKHWPVRIPAAALETTEGVRALGRLGLPVPQRLEGKVKLVKASVEVRCKVFRPANSASDYLQLMAKAHFAGTAEHQVWNAGHWTHMPGHAKPDAKPPDHLIQFDTTALAAAAAWLRRLPLRMASWGHDFWQEQRIQGRDWPEQFLAWLDARPKEVAVELDAELASLRDGVVAGSVRLDVEESKSGIDWFDLSVALDIADSTLNEAEIELLLKAKGRWVRLDGKGWRKLQFALSPEQEEQLADLGLSASQLHGDKQRLHALQLAGLTKKNNSLLPAERVAQLAIRLEEIQTSVAPEIPAAITAELRPYQLDGFKFLAYLSTNRFGGVLADDMGLGKTVQALTWLAWLQAEKGLTDPVLVVCPKSVQENWCAEAVKFFPGLAVTVWDRAAAGTGGLEGDFRLVVIHYQQLRMHEELLRDVPWGAVILDEAQAIKNPTSQTAKAACALPAQHRLALTGTPVENRLMDLWSIFAFAMPGVLGNRASFTKNFDSKEDPLARRRLAARTRPFLLRRTKKEVAKDLPDRVEEDLVIELEGTQATLYQAEIKRARAQLLNVKTNTQLDKLRFNILTSLLRLRQICCHPALVGINETTGGKRGRASAASAVESAKVSALMELVEPLMEEGQKVLVFSQFVSMLEILELEITAREWTSFKLTGETEERGDLVRRFQAHEGSAVFLISLKAGGFGLNLTAASYVVLFDPWWNPAVEAQAIDRTHRIGQKQTVFAYRLLVKNSIEEKIRHLQKQKGALAQDILGEENFAKALTLSDFQFLLSDAPV